MRMLSFACLLYQLVTGASVGGHGTLSASITLPSSSSIILSPSISSSLSSMSSSYSSSLEVSQPSDSRSTVIQTFFDFRKILLEANTTTLDERCEVLFNHCFSMEKADQRLELLLALIKWDEEPNLRTEVISNFFAFSFRHSNLVLPFISNPRYHEVSTFFLKEPADEYQESLRCAYFNSFIAKALDNIDFSKDFVLFPSFFKFFFSNLSYLSKDQKKHYIQSLLEKLDWRLTKNKSCTKETAVKFWTYLMSRPEIDSSFIGSILVYPKCLLSISSRRTILTYACKEDLQIGISKARTEQQKIALEKILVCKPFASLNREMAIQQYFSPGEELVNILIELEFPKIIAKIALDYLGTCEYGQDSFNALEIDQIWRKEDFLAFK